jgi:hypothetical protein
MDSTFEFLHGYTFFKFANYRMLFYLLFFFIFSFSLSFFSNLVENWGVNVQFHGHGIVEGVFVSWMVVVTAPELVGDATSIRLNMLTQSSKIAKKEDEQW